MQNFPESLARDDAVADKFQVVLNIRVDQITVTITDIKGLVLKRSDVEVCGNQKFDMDVSSLRAGTYFLPFKPKMEARS